MVSHPKSMGMSTAPAPQEKRSVQIIRTTVPRPKTLSTTSRTTSDTVTVSSGSSSTTSIYVEDSPLGVPSKSYARLYLPCEEKAESKAPSKEAQANQIQKMHLEYWTRCVMRRTVSLGSRHIRTAEALMELGNAQLMAQQYQTAGKTFLSALKIFQAIYGDMHLSVARALDKVGLAASMTHANLDLALAALSDGLKIRCELLGPDHIDAVDSLNHIAGVRLNRGEVDIAAQNYKAVLQYREQIFGQNHAGVAVTAYTLACIQNDRLDQGREAHANFTMAKNIYAKLGLNQSPYYKDICLRLTDYSKRLEI